MNATEKKIVAIAASIALYIQAEEEALIFSSNKTSNLKKSIRENIWGISGRQELMQMRNIMNMKIFNNK